MSNILRRCRLRRKPIVRKCMINPSRASHRPLTFMDLHPVDANSKPPLLLDHVLHGEGYRYPCMLIYGPFTAITASLEALCEIFTGVRFAFFLIDPYHTSQWTAPRLLLSFSILHFKEADDQEPIVLLLAVRNVAHSCCHAIQRFFNWTWHAD